MRKKFLLFMLTAISAVCLTAGLTACGSSSSGGESSGTTSDWGSGVYTVEAAYAEAQTLGYSGSLEDFITSISGTDGTNGEDGADGSVWYTGSGAPSSSTGKDGDMYLDTASYDIYQMTSGSWAKLGNIKGEAGVVTSGADGSVWYTGSGAPSSSTGKDGDMYLDTASYDIYQMASGSWAKIGNIKGEAGVGTNGVGISSVTLNSDGELIVAYTDSTSTNLGVISTSCTHTYGEWVVGAEATCTSMGYKYRTCSACGDVDYAFIEATGHTFADDAVKCETYGHMLQCTTCNQIITEAHTFDENYYCAACDYYYYSEGLEFSVYTIENNVISFSVSAGTCADSDVIIPIEYKDCPVVAINSFRNYALLTSITIPDSITTIDTGAFYGCISLTSITIPDSVTYIGNSAFYGCISLTSITIPDSVTYIGSYAFYGCYALKSVAIGSGLTYIGNSAFYNCTALKSISLPDGITTIESDAFYNTGYYNNDYNWLNGVMYIGNYLIVAKTSVYGSYTVLDGTTLIAESAFNGCNRLTYVTLREGVTSIPYYAFANCTALIGITIPDSVTSIGDYAFYYCRELKSINIPEGITSIGADAFANCTALIGITIPSSVTSIDDNAFYGCTSLESVIIGDGVTSIGRCAFVECTSLKSIVIGSSVTTIRSFALTYCDALTNVYYNGTAEDWNEITIYDSSDFNSATIYYYSESQPTDSGNYWHYDESGNIVVWATTTTD